jgi:hypothetical protein
MERKRIVAGILEQLCRGYEREIELYRQVRDLAWRQAHVLRSDGSGLVLLQLSADKERLLQSIADVEADLAAARAVVAREGRFLGDGLMNGLHQVLDQLSQVIDEIRALELESYRLIASKTAAERRPQTATQMVSVAG